MTLVDANVWIAYFDLDDTQTSKAKQVINNLESKGRYILLSDFILQEVITVFLYKKKEELINVFINYIEANNNIKIMSIDSDFKHQMLTLAKENNYKPKLSFTDWSLFFYLENLI